MCEELQKDLRATFELNIKTATGRVRYLHNSLQPLQRFSEVFYSDILIIAHSTLIPVIRA